MPSDSKNSRPADKTSLGSGAAEKVRRRLIERRRAQDKLLNELFGPEPGKKKSSKSGKSDSKE